MRRIISVLSAMAMVFMLSVPCFAVKAAKFSAKTVSETDSEIVVTVNYEGGSPFSCFDFEMTYNSKKLKVIEAYDGDGLEAFVREAKRNEGAMVASVINKDSNPIKDSMAITASFRVVDGNDLFVAKFKKLSKDKVTADDIKVVFTNCATETEKIQYSVSNLIGGGSAADKTTVKTSKASQPDKNTVSTSTTKTVTESKTDKSVSEKTDEKYSAVSSETETKTEISQTESISENEIVENSDNSDKKADTKKIILISAVVICVLFVVAAVCVYISKKNKND